MAASSASAEPVTCLSGVGPARAERLAGLGIRTLRDLVLLVPRDLEEMPSSVPVELARGMPGELVRLHGEVAAKRFFRQGGKRSLLRVKLADASGAIEALFFNQPWQRDNFDVGAEVQLVGQVITTKSGPALAAPRSGSAERPLPEPGHLEPLYPVTDGIGQDYLKGLVGQALERLVPRPEGLRGDVDEADAQAGADVPPAGIGERLDPGELEGLDLPGLDGAAWELRYPTSRGAFELARRRIRLEGLMSLAARLVHRRRARLAGEAPAIAPVDLGELAAGLPFQLTGAQERVVGELLGDLTSGRPMGRLVQGDVGSGKTAVAVLAATAVAGAREGWDGAQVALIDRKSVV